MCALFLINICPFLSSRACDSGVESAIWRGVLALAPYRESVMNRVVSYYIHLTDSEAPTGEQEVDAMSTRSSVCSFNELNNSEVVCDKNGSL